MESKNQYEERARRTFGFEKGDSHYQQNPQTEDKKINIMQLVSDVALDAGIAVLGGGASAAILGRLSLPAGILLTAYGHQIRNDNLRTLGIGLMASSNMVDIVKPNPKATIIENSMERLKAFGNNLKSRLCLDLLPKQKEPEKKQQAPESKANEDLKGGSNESKKEEPPKKTTQQHQNNPPPKPAKQNETSSEREETVKKAN